MRVLGILAIFVLTVAAIVEGAVLVRLSSRLDSLDEKVNAVPTPEDTPQRTVRPTLPSEGAVDRPSPRLPLPRLQASAEPLPPPGAGGPATATLAAALQSPEGRQHLKAAMDVLREQERQERLVRSSERAVEREQRYRERLVRLLALPAPEMARIDQLHAALQSGRQRILEEMRAGTKTAEQADDEIDALEDGTERNLRTLLGEPRVRQIREAERAERRRERGGGPPGGPPGAPGAPAPPG